MTLLRYRTALLTAQGSYRARGPFLVMAEHWDNPIHIHWDRGEYREISIAALLKERTDHSPSHYLWVWGFPGIAIVSRDSSCGVLLCYWWNSSLFIAVSPSSSSLLSSLWGELCVGNPWQFSREEFSCTKIGDRFKECHIHLFSTRLEGLDSETPEFAQTGQHQFFTQFSTSVLKRIHFHWELLHTYPHWSEDLYG